MNRRHNGASISFQPRIRRGAFLKLAGIMAAETFLYIIELIYQAHFQIQPKNTGKL